MTTEPFILAAGDATPSDVIGTLASRFATTARQSEVGLVTLYDTFDARLHAAGLALRCDAGGLTLASLDGHVRHRCPDIVTPGFAWDLPEGELRDAIEPVIEMRRLLPVVDIERIVKTVSILDEEDKTVVRVRCENGSARAPDNGDDSSTLPAVVRVLPVKGYERPLDRVLGVLEDDLQLRGGALDEVAIALGAIGRAPARPAGPLPLDPERPAEEALRHIHAHLLETIRINEQGTRTNVDSEFLHEYRVAVRKVRSLLSQVKGVFPAADVARFSAEFRWLAGVTGPARDADVYLLKLPKFRASLPEKSRDDLAPLAVLLRERQTEAYRTLASVIDSDRYHRLMTSWAEYLKKPVVPSTCAPNATRPVHAVAAQRIRKIARRVLRDGAAIDDASPATALHELRLVCKKLRYLIDGFAGLYDPAEVKPLRRSLKKLQDNLGDFNDCELQQEWLTACAREMAARGACDVDTFLAMGRLEDRLQIGQAKARKRFGSCFDRFAGPDNRRRIDRLFSRKRSRA